MHYAAMQVNSSLQRAHTHTHTHTQTGSGKQQAQLVDLIHKQLQSEYGWLAGWS